MLLQTTTRNTVSTQFYEIILVFIEIFLMKYSVSGKSFRVTQILKSLFEDIFDESIKKIKKIIAP